MFRRWIQSGSFCGRQFCRAGGLAVILMLTAGENEAKPKTEAEAKVLWVVNIARFVTWEPASETKNEPLRIAVVEAQKLYATLKQYDGKTINGRTIQTLFVEEFSAQEILKGFDILYVPDSVGDDTQTVLNFVKSQGVFTIGESSAFINRGGVMALYIKDGSICYELNRSVAQREKIKISSELLGRAARVVSEEAP